VSVPALSRDAPGVDALRSAVDAMDALVTLLDPSGRVLHVNHAWRVLAATGEAGADPVALATGYGGGAQAAAILAGVRDVVAGRRQRFEAEYRHGSAGTPRWLALRATPIAVDGVGAILIHDDVTARRAADRETTRADDRDGATGLANRRLLERRLEQLLAEGPVGLLALRLHHTDPGAARGAAADEESLRETAALLGRLVGDDAVAGRHGADVLVVLLPGADDAALRRATLPLQAGWHARLGHRSDLDVAVGSAVGRPGEDAHDVLARAAMATWPGDAEDDAPAGAVVVVPEHLDTRTPVVREPRVGVGRVRLEALGRRRTLPQS
jgi:GGDEF domain-containing protein